MARYAFSGACSFEKYFLAVRGKMMTSVAFDPGRDRDAWATIRGYVYQAEVTLDRWLALADGEILELERGEDIDLLERAAAAQGGQRERLLEQVKHLESSVTLRSGPVRAFLANAHAHRTQNASLSLHFRFTTTAKPGTERPTSIPRAVPGIVAWEQIRAGTWPAEELDRARSAIRELLSSPTVPDDLPEGIWVDFQAFVPAATDSEFDAFLASCEWSTHHIPAAEYETHLRTALVAMGLVPDLAAAGSLYDRLLIFVFRSLTQPGDKRLSRQNLLEQEELWRRGVPLSPEDDRRLRELRELVGALETRIGAVESAVSDLHQVTAASTAMIETMARERGIAAAVEYVAAAPVLAEPPPVDRASLRRRTIAEILEQRAAATWIAIHGVSGIGKSQLALLLAREVGATRVWIRFRDLVVPQACLRFDTALAQLAGGPAPELSGRGGWAAISPEGALARLGRGAVIVLDDLPRYQAGDELSIRLLALVRSAAQEGVLVLSTSPLPVPTGVLEGVLDGQVLACPAPPFSVEDVQDVLLAYGAPEKWWKSGLGLMVHAATKGHPTLVRACARDLAAHGWTADDQALNRVLGSLFAAGVNDETVRALISSTPNPATRELLFRLNLIDGEFGVEEVQLLAGVDPVIATPRGHLDPLLGLWVQSDVGGRYAVSPLVRPLGDSELAPETRRSCHWALADRIVSGRRMGDAEATSAISHFVRADAYDQAGWVLLRGLVALRDVELPLGLLPVFTLVWLDSTLPDGMDLGLRLQLRALQIGFCLRADRDPGFVQRDLDSLIKGASDAERWAVFSASMFAAQALASTDVAAAGRYLLQALQLRPHVLSELGERNLTAPDMPLEQLVWVLTTGVDSPAALMEWMDVVVAMTPEQRAAAFEQDELSHSGALHVTNLLLSHEQKKAPEQQDWMGVQEGLARFAERARETGLVWLADAAVVTRMTVHGEFLRDLPAAEALSEEVLSRPGLDRDSEFWVTNSRALLLYDYGPKDRAIEWLARAFALRTPTHGWQSVRAGIYLSIRLGESDPRRAVEILTEATEFADAHVDAVGLSRVEAYGERGVAEWLAEDRRAAFRTWDRTAALLLQSRDDSSNWKSIFVLFAHINGYFASMTRSGHPPADLAVGEPYAAPIRGLFVLRPAGRDSLFDESKMPALAVQLTMFADALGARDRAAAWASVAVEQGRATGWYQSLGVVLPMLVAEALERDDYEQALLLSKERWAILEAARVSPPPADSLRTRPPADVLGSDGNDAWLAVESMALTVLVPLYFRLAVLARRSPDEARSRLSGLRVALLASAARSADPAPWQRAADLFDAVFASHASDRELVALVNGLSFRHPDASRALKVVGYLAASAPQGVSPERSLALQIATVPIVGLQVLPDTRAYADAAGEFFAGMWRERIQNARFRFSSPAAVEQLLDSAGEAGPDQARLALAAVCYGLGAQPPADVQIWLSRPWASR